MYRLVLVDGFTLFLNFQGISYLFRIYTFYFFISLLKIEGNQVTIREKVVIGRMLSKKRLCHLSG